MRYNKQNKNWVWNESAWMEDLKSVQTGESKDERMRRLCLPVMNDINPDLSFTAEVAGDFENGRLPTLDFELWMDDEGLIHHSFFQKAMKCPYVVMKRSGMAQQQKFSIVTNDLIRRLSNTDFESNNQTEVIRVI